ncbi:MAG: GNAT family N-acetyltransferase [Gaiellaceae bacterium]
MIREARPDEAELLAGIQRDASVAALAHIYPPERYPFPMDEIRRRWAQAVSDPEVTVVVAETDRQPAGIAGYRSVWLDGLYVLPGLWGRGIAGELHDHVLDQLRGLGSERCHLWVLEDNHRARHFYERRGWHENGDTRVVPYPPNPLDVGYTIDLESRLASA